MSTKKRSQSPAPSGSGRAPAAASGMDAKVSEKKLPQTAAWHSGIFDVCSSGPMVCIASFCCPMVQHGLNAYGLELKKNPQAAHGLDVAHVEMIKHSASPACGTCLGALCTFCVSGAMAASMSFGQRMDPTHFALLMGEAAPLFVAVYAVIGASWCCVNPLLVHRPFRKYVRASYGIKESDQSCGNDFVTTCFCTPCHHIQVATQINKVRVPNVRD